MQPLLLDPETSDELLLERLNIACSTETEQKNKRKSSASQSVTSVNVVQSDTPPVKSTVKKTKTKLLPELMTEIQELKTGVASLKGLSAEIAQIKETLQRPGLQPQLHASPAGSLDRSFQSSTPSQQFYSRHSQLQAHAPVQCHYGKSLPASKQVETNAVYTVTDVEVGNIFKLDAKSEILDSLGMSL